VAAQLVAGVIYRMPLDDCLGMCRFNNRGVGPDYIADLLKAATGWDFTGEEALTLGHRVVNLLRVFNLRHGITADLEMPSRRYGSAPIDGPHQGKTIAPVWREAVQNYYKLMGWDTETSKPLPETLKRLGLENLINDV
jgi:aldehyde:ferredoxin oxidoreductase